MPPLSPQRMIACATPTSSADHPLLHPRKCAILTKGLRPSLDERWGSGHVMEVRYGLRHVCGACGNEASFHKITGRRAFACSLCGDHVYPCAGTIFKDSRTSLQSWFYAIYLFVVTRHGVSGKELQRALGVTYKTAWRMGQQIRKLMGSAAEFEIPKGHVHLEEAVVGRH